MTSDYMLCRLNDTELRFSIKPCYIMKITLRILTCCTGFEYVTIASPRDMNWDIIVRGYSQAIVIIPFPSLFLN